MANSTKISEYSTTAANNTSIDSIDIDENCAASGINNAIRSVLKHQADAFTQGTPIALDQTNNRVGIGTSGPSTTLQVGDGSADTRSTFNPSSAFAIGVKNGANHGGFIGSNGSSGMQFSSSGGAHSMTIDSNGNVGIGTTSVNASLDVRSAALGTALQLSDDTNYGVNFIGVSGGLRMKMNGAQTLTIDQNSNADVFHINGSGNIGINTSTPASLLEIKASALNRANGIALRGSGANDILYMYPSADNVATIEHLIDGSTSTGGTIAINPQGGNVGIGTSSPASQLTLGGTSDLVFTQNGYGIAWGSNNGSPRIYGVSSGALTFKHGGGSTAMTIESNGNVRINNTSNATYSAFLNILKTAGTNATIHSRVPGTGASSHIIFGSDTADAVGSIDTNGSATSYNTSSDYRLKENVADMTGAIDRVKALAPKRFNFIADADRTVDGFLAHEAQAVVPEAVTGTHNEVDDDGNAVMQGIDQSKLVPLLTGALKEAITKIETLETEMTALKARVTALEA